MNYLDDLAAIAEVTSSVLTFIKELISGLASLFVSLIDILYYIGYSFTVFISVVTNPYLLFFMILGTGFYYASFKARSRKDLINKTGEFYKYTFEIGAKVGSYVMTAVSRFITGILSMI